jgi:hypothetical protein
MNEPKTTLVGIEPAGRGLDTPEHGAVLAQGTPGVLHGMRSFVLQTPDGQILPTHSISAGLDYPSVGPEHAYLQAEGLAQYASDLTHQGELFGRWQLRPSRDVRTRRQDIDARKVQSLLPFKPFGKQVADCTRLSNNSAHRRPSPTLRIAEPG